MSKILSELYSEDNNRKAIIFLQDEVIAIDYYEDSKYTRNELLYGFTFQQAKDKAEDYVLFQEHL